jgi:micrococcal nuclease
MKCVALSLALTLSAIAHAEIIQFRGAVKAVHDGDTLRMTSGDTVVKVRLADIDAPELTQRYGHESKRSLEQLTRDKPVDATCTGKDRYGRLLCTLIVGKLDVNAAQIERGMAWVYQRYVPKRTPLKVAEADAARGNRGLWADANAIAPWEYRRAQKD